ncbi:NAD(P)-dependent alcohol dehydrogenase [Jiangella asiatica]|uniref:NAD(P)-dependent alcohol dehydrogenase n=1 Tax=Jiangella asiatica TaxID=2530372 RepID=A0A4R5DM89_9ACTN|nr:NAD(P)-dependent alcohol dehydrogenase [Jiangella asiatica]TDE11783.1 NAD(P)-dependent alcohol dehydrogenase [Jiangella asiatica]
MTSTAMRVARYHRYGDPDVLRIDTVDIPRPGRREVLVRVHGASVNPSDALMRSGAMRVATGWRFPKGVGLDLAGEVILTGDDVTDLPAGSQVWAYVGGLPTRLGTTAEYVAVRRDRCAAAPRDLDLVAAAALPTVGVTALQVLRDTVRLRAGDRALIVAAGGGVGSAAVQLAHAMGAAVTAVAGAGSADLCRELGAVDVLDYAAGPPTGERFDVIVDAHGTGVRGYRRLLARGGRMATIVTRAVPYALVSPLLPGPRVRVHLTKARASDLEVLAGYVERGDLRPVVDRIYPLEDVAVAHRAVETGHARGKRVIALT